MTLIAIVDAYITLQQLLKSEGIIYSGGYAKSFLQTETVLVNAEREQRRGRKLYPGDTIAWSNHLFVITASTDGGSAN